MPDGSRSSAASPAVLKLLPSCEDLIFLAIVGALIFTPLGTRLLGDAGIGWHIRTGQQIISTHAIARVDPFSSTMFGKPWFAWEWLYDLLAGWFDRIMGLAGVVSMTAVVIAMVFSILHRLLVRRGASLLTALGFTLLALSASTIHFLARPHVFTWLFTLIWFAILDSSERHHKQLRWLPFLMLLWVNIHGGFLIGFILLAIFLAGYIWEWRQTRSDRLEDTMQRLVAAQQTRNLAYLAFASFVASLINPYGRGLYMHIFGYLSNRFLMRHIDEFQSPNFHDLAPRCFLVLVLIAVALLMTRGRTLRMSHRLTALFAIASGLYASRNIPIASILLAMIVGPLLPAPQLWRDFSARMTALELRPRLQPSWIYLLVLVWIWMSRGQIISNIHFDSHRMPVAAVDYVQTRALSGPVLTPDYWGGYLIYRLYPQVKVVVDDRHDLYGEEFLKAYLKTIHAEPGWQEFLEASKPSCLILPTNAPLTAVLRESKDWKSIYHDDTATLFIAAR